MLAVWSIPARCGAQELDEAGQSALMFMGHVMHPRPDGAHHGLLQALRFLRDPELTPLFEHLATSSETDMRVHGLLGLAEIYPDRALPAALLSGIDDPKIVTLLVSAASDDKLLTDEQAQQMLDQPDIETGMRLVLIARFKAYDDPEQQQHMREMLESDHFGRRHMAALLLHQAGDKAGTKVLGELNQSDNARRDMVRAELLQNVRRMNLDKAVTWAHQIAQEDDPHPMLELLAVRTMIQFGDDDGLTTWRDHFESTDSFAQKIRLAVTLWQVAPQVEPGAFEPLLESEYELIRQIGRAGAAISSKSPDTAQQLLDLAAMSNPAVNASLLSYLKAMPTLR